MLAAADRIEIYGLGGSGIVAQDAQHKFFRLGVPVVAYSDPTVHAVSASLLEPGCVIVAISQSGETQDVITSAELGLAAGAKVIAITAADSPLARIATLCLPMNSLEDEDFYAPIKSRMAHLAIVDVLAVGVALSRGAGFPDGDQALASNPAAFRYALASISFYMYYHNLYHARLPRGSTVRCRQGNTVW